jgi:hypothetical protein
MKTIASFVGCLMMGAVLAAQTQKPSIAPAPRAADGKPDLSGVYQASTRRGPAWDAEAPGGEAPGQAAPRAPGDARPVGGAREPIPFQPWALARAQEILNRRSIDDPATYCIPQSSPRITGVGLFPTEFVQTPKKIVIMYEYFWQFRGIPITDKHPDDVDPSFMGDSIGRWDGDTLVVDVVGFKPGGWIGGGFVHSDALHLTERYTRIDKDQLNYEVTIEDPKVLTKPYTQRSTLMLREGTRLREYSCSENNMDPKFYEKLLADPSTFLRTPAATPATPPRP